MKNLSKLMAITLTAMAIFFTANVKAQTTPANSVVFSIGAEAADPTGTARLGSHFVLGGTARLQYGITNNLAVTLTSGAYHFFPIKNPVTGQRYESYGVIPIKAGLKEFFLPNIYVGAEAGVGLEITDSGWGPKKLLLSPALGYANKHWDIGAHYENFSSGGGKYGLVALRLAYGFEL
jgi:hypothetical protein